VGHRVWFKPQATGHGGTRDGGGYRRRQLTTAAAGEQAMTFHEGLAKGRHDDAKRAGQRDRPLLEAQQARTACHHRIDPAARTWRLDRLMFRRG
jgi:hypothetical protein